jgi:OFA family oxalate/formate antiporter-like MFS transporter
MINPDGYQAVLYLTVALYIVALLVSFFMVDHKKKSKVAEQ